MDQKHCGKVRTSVYINTPDMNLSGLFSGEYLVVKLRLCRSDVVLRIVKYCADGAK